MCFFDLIKQFNKGPVKFRLEHFLKEAVHSKAGWVAMRSGKPPDRGWAPRATYGRQSPAPRRIHGVRGEAILMLARTSWRGARHGQ